MLVNLNLVSHVCVSGLTVELHFKDNSSHMRRFSSVDDMLATIRGWQSTTEQLDSAYAQPDLPARTARAKADRAARRRN